MNISFYFDGAKLQFSADLAPVLIVFLLVLSFFVWIVTSFQITLPNNLLHKIFLHLSNYQIICVPLHLNGNLYFNYTHARFVTLLSYH